MRRAGLTLFRRWLHLNSGESENPALSHEILDVETTIFIMIPDLVVGCDTVKPVAHQRKVRNIH